VKDRNLAGSRSCRSDLHVCDIHKVHILNRACGKLSSVKQLVPSIEAESLIGERANKLQSINSSNTMSYFFKCIPSSYSKISDRDDEPCNLFRVENRAIAMSYFAVGVVLSLTSTPLNIYLVETLSAGTSTCGFAYTSSNVMQ
jgi:hypothetical protein